MEYICRSCGKSVKNTKEYDLFEQMHWICFHFEFEHGEYDLDEPCDDPSCPWNRISKNSVNIIGSQMDARLKSESTEAVLYINQKEIQKEYLPSRKCSILYKDEELERNIDVWFEDEVLMGFTNGFEPLVNGAIESITIQSMSPNEFYLKLSKLNSRGYFLVELSINKRVVNRDYVNESIYNTQFDVLVTEIERFNNQIRILLEQ